MDGKTFLRYLRESIGESSTSAFLNNRTSYEYGWEAACELVRRTRALRSTQSITTVASQQGYVLNADFLSLDLRNRDGEFLLKYNDGTDDTWVSFVDYDTLIYANQTDAVTVPSRFSVIDKPTLYSQITGTATSAGTVSAGLSTLTDTSGLFTTTDYVSAGDVVHNTTSGAYGYVLSVASATAIETAIFNDSTGAAAGWAQNDNYVIQPQGRLQIMFDPPPSTSGHTATVYYIQRPAPVFHDYGVYRFLRQYTNAIVEYAAAKCKLADREENYWNDFMKEWARKLSESAAGVNSAYGRKGFTMSMRGNK